MMAAFIIAIRGTVLQAVLLGLAATVSHTAIVWAIALAGLYFGARWNTEATEPYLQLVSAVLIIGIALWMLWRTRKAQSHDHHHDMGPHSIDTGDGSIAIDVFEDGVPPRWRIERLSGPTLSPACLSLQTMRPDGSSQTFTFAEVDGLLESEQEIPEPHEFTATVRLAYDNHAHDYTLQFHEHDHSDDLSGLHVGAGNAVDAHQREHADDIRKRFANRNVTTGQIVLFGLTGGLIPCPASLTILLLCLQLKQFTLGATLVLCCRRRSKRAPRCDPLVGL
jgi:nickel/cobalt transporter (NicO) family protein